MFFLSLSFIILDSCHCITACRMFVSHCHYSFVFWHHNLLCRFIVIPKLPIIFKGTLCRKTQTILGKMENNMLKWYGHIVCMEDYR